MLSKINQRSLRSLKSCFQHSLIKRNMRLVQFVADGKNSVGVEVEKDGGIVDLCKFDSSVPNNMREFLQLGSKMADIAKKAKEQKASIIERSAIQLKAPVTPTKVIGIGMNYVDHCEEQNAPIPKEPIVFGKFPNSIQDPYGPILLPTESKAVDWEVELAIIIGKGGSHIKENDVMDHVAGYCVAHDVSARDLQLKKNGGQWLLGKTFDTFCPIGPALVTPDEISDPHNLGIRCRVNGKTMQDSRTSNLIFKTKDIISYISRFFSLSAGDVIVTGTPPGVGCFRDPPVYLKPGDIVECEIDEIGCIRNEVIAHSKF